MVAALKVHLASGKPVRIPAGGELLWGWFCDLSAGRSFHAAGPNPLSWGDMAGYFALTREPVGPEHIGILRAMDAAWMAAHYDGTEAPRGDVKTAPRIAERPITAELFDSLFGN